MVKKKTTKKKNSVKKKKIISKPTYKKHVEKPLKILDNEKAIEKILIQNFVSLQKVMTHLSIKFENLTLQISKLLELFEISAKTLAKKDFESNQSKKDEEKIIKKIDTLLDQNKIIAKGLTLMHEKEYGELPIKSFPPTPQITKPMPKSFHQARQQNPIQPSPKQTSQEITDASGYQKSISSQIPNIDGLRTPQKNAQQNPTRV